MKGINDVENGTILHFLINAFLAVLNVIVVYLPHFTLFSVGGILFGWLKKKKKKKLGGICAFISQRKAYSQRNPKLLYVNMFPIHIHIHIHILKKKHHSYHLSLFSKSIFGIKNLKNTFKIHKFLSYLLNFHSNFL